MSARDDLIFIFGRQASLAISERRADEILAKHAHELAEKIRNACPHYSMHGECWCDGAYLIDLEMPE